MVGGGDRISNFLMAEEVNKKLKKKLQHQCPTIKYYENTKCALNGKVTKKIRTIVMCLSSSRKCW
jgi:CRISPR/Cas system CMR-associated protein Cmr3 (group 5 of RAMP superfamily)